jgi:hypothetical protein
MLEKGEEVIPAFESAKASVLSKEFGAELKSHHIQSLILTSLVYDGYTKDEVKEALKIYNNLDMSVLMQKPSRIRRVGVYIGYLTIMYVVLSGMYFVYVIPQVLSMFEAMEIPAPDIFTWFTGNWTTILIFVLAALIVALLVSTIIKEMFDFKKELEKSVVYRLFLPKSIKAKYKKLISLLRFPLHIVKKQNNGINDAIIQYYLNEKYQSTEISDSLSLLISESAISLLILSESYIRRIYVVVAILIIFSIFAFVSSAYIPLFSMGEIV